MANTVNCIYPWTHPCKTCFHVTSNVWVSGVKLSSFHAQMWSVVHNKFWKWEAFLIISSFLADESHLPFEQCREGELRCLTSSENMFCVSAFTGRCNQQYIGLQSVKYWSICQPFLNQYPQGGYLGFQVMGMIEWSQKSRPPKIPRASSKTQKIPAPKINPQKIPHWFCGP